MLTVNTNDDKLVQVKMSSKLGWPDDVTFWDSSTIQLYSQTFFLLKGHNILNEVVYDCADTQGTLSLFAES